VEHMSAKHVKDRPIYIGLTGGIASGKTTAANYFRTLDIPVIDCDMIVANLWKYEKNMVETIERTLAIELKSQEDKKNLAHLIFNDEKQRKRLNQIIHPYVFDEIEKQKISFIHQKIVVIDMPLLFEVGYEKQVDYTLLVYVPQAIQIKRLRERNHMKHDDIISRIHAQMRLIEKKKVSNFILDNTKSIEYLHHQIDDVIKRVLHEE